MDEDVADPAVAAIREMRAAFTFLIAAAGAAVERADELLVRLESGTHRS